MDDEQSVLKCVKITCLSSFLSSCRTRSIKDRSPSVTIRGPKPVPSDPSFPSNMLASLSTWLSSSSDMVAPVPSPGDAPAEPTRYHSVLCLMIYTILFYQLTPNLVEVNMMHHIKVEHFSWHWDKACAIRYKQMQSNGII
jgi:hypothetical protein